MVQSTQTRLPNRAMIPVFGLPTADGGRVDLWELKRRKNVVLAFLPPDCSRCEEFLNSVSGARDRYEEENAVFVAVIRGGGEEASEVQAAVRPSYPIAYDETGRVTGMYTDTIPAVFVADRYGELREQFVSEPGEELPSQSRVLDVVELINLECPE
mgnify:CR=1 FL=1